MAVITVYASDALLDHLLGRPGHAYTQPTVFLGLLTTLPTMPAGTGAVEVSTAGGSAYVREQVSGVTSAASGGSASTNADLNWPVAGTNWGTIIGVGLYDSATVGAGNLLAAGPLNTSKTINAGNNFILPAGQLVVTLA